MPLVAGAIRAYRTLRFGSPIIVVSGLPRSGTSMVMRMLEAGGVPIVTDGVRAADESNPHGYFEDERVKELDKAVDKSWLRDARGKALKIISFLLRDLPAANNYRVIFMKRSLDELLASQDAMLRARGEPADAPRETLAKAYDRHLREVRLLLRDRPQFDVLELDHREVLDTPLEQARRIADFLGQPLDPRRMAEAVDPSLHRNRTGPRR
jgi:hypothetical protein